MPNPNWTKIKAEYLKGGTSYRKLAAKYGVSLSTVQRKSTAEKWADLRKQTAIKTNTKLTDTVASQEMTRINTLQDAADALLIRIQEGITSGVFGNNTQSIKQLTGALKDLQQIKGYKSDLDIKEQEARIEKLRKESGVDNQDNEIKVVIQDEIEEYAE